MLTAKEFDVIEFLMRNANRVYSREALLDTIWAYEYRSDIRTNVETSSEASRHFSIMLDFLLS